VGPSAGLDAMAKREIPRRGPNPGRPARRLVAILAEYFVKHSPCGNISQM